MPDRIQLRRTRGWRLPTGVKKVDRTTPFGNPFRVGHEAQDAAEAVRMFDEFLYGDGDRLYVRRGEIVEYPPDVVLLAALGGRDLACWCSPTAPCHGDVLIAYVNALSEEYVEPWELV